LLQILLGYILYIAVGAPAGAKTNVRHAANRRPTDGCRQRLARRRRRRK
jgi:hypothetical protein